MDDFERDYFATDEQVKAAAKPRPRASVGVKFINSVECDQYAAMVQCVAAHGLDRVGFEVEDEDTGKITVLVPELTDMELEKLALIHDAFAPLISLARSMGPGGTQQQFDKLKKEVKP